MVKPFLNDMVDDTVSWSSPSSSSSLLFDAPPKRNIYTDTLALRDSLASVPEHAFDPEDTPMRPPPALISINGPSTFHRVQKAVKDARGDRTNPRWSHVVQAAQTSYRRHRKYLWPSVPTYMHEARKGQVRPYPETSEEWLAKEGPIDPPKVMGGVRGSQKDKRQRKIAHPKVNASIFAKVQQWQQGIIPGGPFDARPTSSFESQVNSQGKLKVQTTQTKIAFKTSKRSSQQSAAGIASTKANDSNLLTGSTSSNTAPLTKVANHSRHESMVGLGKPVLTPSIDLTKGAQLPSSHASREHNLLSDSCLPSLLPSHTIRRSTPTRKRRRHSGLSSPPETPCRAVYCSSSADAPCRDVSPSSQVPSVPPISSLLVPASDPECVSETYRGQKRGRPITPPSDPQGEVVPSKRPRANSSLNTPALGPDSLTVQEPAPPDNGPGALNHTPRISTTPTSPHISSLRLRVGKVSTPSLKTAPSWKDEPGDTREAVQTRAQRTPYKPSADAEARAIARADAGPIPNLTELLRSTAQRASKRLNSARKAKAVKKTHEYPIPASTQSRELFHPFDASIAGNDEDEAPPATPCPPPLHPPPSSLHAPALDRSAPLEPVHTDKTEFNPRIASESRVIVVPSLNNEGTKLVTRSSSETNSASPIQFPRTPSPPPISKSPVTWPIPVDGSCTSEEPSQPCLPLLTFTQQPDLFAPVDASIPGLDRTSHVVEEGGPSELPSASTKEDNQPGDRRRPTVLLSPIPAFSQQPGLFAPEDASFNGADHIPSSQPESHIPSQPHHADFLGVGMSPTLLRTDSLTLGRSGEKAVSPAASGSGIWVSLPRVGSGSWGTGAGFGGMPVSSQLEGDVEADVNKVS